MFCVNFKSFYFTKQFFTFHFNRVLNVKNKFLLSVGAFVEKYFQSIFILASVLFVLYREAFVV